MVRLYLILPICNVTLLGFDPLYREMCSSKLVGYSKYMYEESQRPENHHYFSDEGTNLDYSGSIL